MFPSVGQIALCVASAHRARFLRVASGAVGFLLIACSTLVSCAPPAGEGSLDLPEVPAPALSGSALPNAERQPLLVYLPPSYRSGTRRYPVVYYLPGFTTDVTEYIDGSIQGLHMRLSMDAFVRQGRLRELIIVVINGRNVLGGSFYVDSPVSGRWESFVVRDVIPWVESRYRTIDQASARGVAGDSMGGFGALNLALHHPDLFGAVYAASPGLFAPDGLAEQGMFGNQEKISRLLDAADSLEPLPVPEARKRLLAHIRSLYSAGEREAYREAFAWAYGAAFAPTPGAAPPFVDWPYRRVGRGLEVVAEKLARFDSGYGNWEEKLARGGEGLRRLSGLVLDCAENDANTWIPKGCEHLSELLTRAEVAHELRWHPGSHLGSLRFRIEYEMLPFFSERLAEDPR